MSINHGLSLISLKANSIEFLINKNIIFFYKKNGQNIGKFLPIYGKNDVTLKFFYWYLHFSNISPIFCDFFILASDMHALSLINFEVRIWILLYMQIHLYCVISTNILDLIVIFTTTAFLYHDTRHFVVRLDSFCLSNEWLRFYWLKTKKKPSKNI